MLSNIINSKFFNTFCSIISITFSTFALAISSFNAYKYSESAFVHQINYEDSQDDIKDQNEIIKKVTSTVAKSNLEDKIESNLEKKINENKDLNDDITIIDKEIPKNVETNKLDINKKKLELNPKIIKQDTHSNKNINTLQVRHSKKNANKSNFCIQLISFANQKDARIFIQESKFKDQLSLNKVLINKNNFYQVLLNDKSFNSENAVKKFINKNNIKNYLIKKSSK